MADSMIVRSGNMKAQTGNKTKDMFHKEFDANYAVPLTQTHIL